VELEILVESVFESVAVFFSAVLAAVAVVVLADVRLSIFPSGASSADTSAVWIAIPLPFPVSCTGSEPARVALAEATTEVFVEPVPCVAVFATVVAAFVWDPNWLTSSTLVPSEASSDCKPELKLAVFDAADNTLRAADPVVCPTPSALLTPGVDPLPTSISIPVAMAMQTDNAEVVPNEGVNGLEPCQEWDRKSRFRKFGWLSYGVFLKFCEVLPTDLP